MSASEATNRIENLLGRVLGAGSMLSAALLAAGLLLLIVTPGTEAGTLVLRAGLVILMITPFARVLVATIAYVAAKEWSSALMAGTVLAVLAGSIVIALVR